MATSTSTSTALRPYARRAGAHTGVALVLNLLVLGIGTLAGASFLVPPATEVGVVAVTLATVLALAVGFALAAVVVRRGSPRAVRVVQVAGAVLAALSLLSPLLIDVDAATKASLFAMHVIPGVAWVLALQPYATRSGARSAVPATA